MSSDFRCFVLMSFDPAYREIYDNIYKPVCAENGLSCWRVDEVSRPGSITRDIVEGIFDSDVVIADLTSRNANVFYELGIAHCAGNKTIMTAQSMSDVPFDISNYRVLLYEQSIAGSRKFAVSLDAAIKELVTALDRTNNPIQEVLSGRSAVGQKTKEPLIKYVDLTLLPWRMRQYLRDHGVVYAEDVNKINLNDLRETKGIGKTSLGYFFSAVLRHNLYTDTIALQQFLLHKGVSVQPWS